ncbi:unnamed protein product [Brachionus calyciflorus]|uniref:Uncharacterized protein n=1 Tax=Brachionus calyciflorus TaxID=104777 RepID=A0A814R9J2_9BILA|nr:unnamed protein product [Brachionus calyciflorus]
MLGGMWGFKNSLKRNLSNEIYNLIISKNIIEQYSRGGTRQRDSDQSFLYQYIYFKMADISVIHDSFFCGSYPNSRPFPTRRKGDCYVGSIGFCNESKGFYTCPDQCRPKDHPDWISC